MIGLSVATAQTKEQKQPIKEDSIKKEKYKQVIILTPYDYDNSLKGLVNWQRLVIYDDLLTPEQRIQTAQEISKVIKDMSMRISLKDSIPDTTKHNIKLPVKRQTPRKKVP